MDTQFIDGAAIRRLMRLHKVTIRVLAKRMNITQKRVRFVREKGITGVACQDWQEAIAGIGCFASLPEGVLS